MRPPRVLDCPGDHCPGFYRASNLPPDHPWFGRPVPCSCALRRQAQQCIHLLPIELRRMTFATFQAAPHQGEALKFAQAFAADPWQGPPLFTLIGPNRAPPHSWFIGFAPVDHPRVAIAVLVENGGTGGTVAAPIARDVLTAALKSEGMNDR